MKPAVVRVERPIRSVNPKPRSDAETIPNRTKALSDVGDVTPNMTLVRPILPKNDLSTDLEAWFLELGSASIPDKSATNSLFRARSGPTCRQSLYRCSSAFLPGLNGKISTIAGLEKLKQITPVSTRSSFFSSFNI